MTRIYTCNWQDCDKGYETLNHLNTHVKIQSHGLKRTAKGITTLPTSSFLVARLSAGASTHASYRIRGNP